MLKRIWRASILLGGILISGCGTGHVSAAELDLIVEALRLEPGSVVADVGAGKR